MLSEISCLHAFTLNKLRHYAVSQVTLIIIIIIIFVYLSKIDKTYLLGSMVVPTATAATQTIAYITVLEPTIRDNEIY